MWYLAGAGRCWRTGFLNSRMWWASAVTVAALDPFRGYGAALSAGLPNAVRVLDPFHVVRLGFAAVDDVRRRVQQETCGHRGRRGDPLYGIRRVLRRGADNLTEHAWARLLSGRARHDFCVSLR